MTAPGPRLLSSRHPPGGAAPSPAELRRRAAEENRRSFLRMVSHELRTPLNSIIGFSEIISCELYGPLNEPRYREHADIIRQSGHKLLRLVNQVVEIARLESGAADLDIGPESAPALAAEVLQSLRPEADARNVTLRLETEEALPSVMADARGLRTVLCNLVQNAVAFAPDGTEVCVAIRARGRYILIEVRDHGEGIPQKDLARVMRPFEQRESALTRRNEGAGLGLPIVKLLCDAMDGHLRLQPADGGGLQASVRLPAVSAAGVQAA